MNSYISSTISPPNSIPAASPAFLNTNTLIGKTSIIILLAILIIVSIRIIINVFYWLFAPSANPRLVNGMLNSDIAITVPSDLILKSVNEDKGVEFSWSTWLYIKNFPDDEYKTVFYKGQTRFQAGNSRNYPENAPGLYLTPNKNELTVIMNTFEDIDEEILIPNIPLNKWINVIIRCENSNLDVYINGSVAKSHKLFGVPKQNDGDVTIGGNKGFNGSISNLTYFSHGLSLMEIRDIVSSGPSLTVANTDNVISKTSGISRISRKMLQPDYLSMRWFFNNRLQ